MTGIGERAGKLDDVMEALGLYYEREHNIKKSIKNAVLYPSVLLMMLAIVIAVLVIGVLPIFSNVFESLGIQPDSRYHDASGKNYRRDRIDIDYSVSCHFGHSDTAVPFRQKKGTADTALFPFSGNSAHQPFDCFGTVCLSDVNDVVKRI